MKRRDFLTRTATTAIAVAALPACAKAQGRAEQWEIGPVIRGENYSVGMPAHPVDTAEGFHFDFPFPTARDGHVHYVTRPGAPMDDARGIRLRYRIDAAPGTRFVAQEFEHLPATLALYFQVRGDDWSGRGSRRFARWYSPIRRLARLEPGEFDLTIMFDDNWKAVTGPGALREPRRFRESLAQVETVGFVFGSRRGLGHGVFATGPARFTVLEYEVLR